MFPNRLLILSLPSYYPLGRATGVYFCILSRSGISQTKMLSTFLQLGKNSKAIKVETLKN